MSLALVDGDSDPIGLDDVLSLTVVSRMANIGTEVKYDVRLVLMDHSKRDVTFSGESAPILFKITERLTKVGFIRIDSGFIIDEYSFGTDTIGVRQWYRKEYF